jgi:hypothetical protein
MTELKGVRSMRTCPWAADYWGGPQREWRRYGVHTGLEHAGDVRRRRALPQLEPDYVVPSGHRGAALLSEEAHLMKIDIGKLATGI